MNWVKTSLLMVGASGCSLIYNPSNLPPAPSDGVVLLDLPPDEPVIDADPSMLTLDPIAQGPLLEGQGVGGSQPGVLFVSGMNLIEGATLTIVQHDANPDVVVTVGEVVVAVTHHSIGAVVTANLSPLAESVGLLDLDVTVTQPPPNETVSQTVTWKFKPLDTYTAAGSGVAAPPDGKVFSDAAISATVNFAGGPASRRAIVRAVANITVTGAGTAITANATGAVGGAGGCAGGPKETDGSCFGKGHGSTTGGGGGGGFSVGGTAGTGGGAAGSVSGTAEIATYGGLDTVAENRGGGGGGGGNSGLGAAGGVGGGGGGTIELTAGGDLTLTGVTLTAKGDAGGQGGLAANGGGGGAGGVVLLRAGGTMTAPMGVDVSGGIAGPGNTGSAAGGPGAPGRIRVDTTSNVTVAGAYAGPWVVRPASPIVRGAQTIFDLAASSNDTFQVVARHPDGTSDARDVTAFSGQQVAPLLQPGFNRVCTVVNHATLADVEGTNCIEVVYVP